MLHTQVMSYWLNARIYNRAATPEAAAIAEINLTVLAMNASVPAIRDRAAQLVNARNAQPMGVA